MSECDNLVWSLSKHHGRLIQTQLVGQYLSPVSPAVSVATAFVICISVVDKS